MKEKNRMPRIEGTRKEIGTGLEPKLIGRQRYRVPPSIASSLAGHFFFFFYPPIAETKTEKRFVPRAVLSVN